MIHRELVFAWNSNQYNATARPRHFCSELIGRICPRGLKCNINTAAESLYQQFFPRIRSGRIDRYAAIFLNEREAPGKLFDNIDWLHPSQRSRLQNQQPDWSSPDDDC